MTPRRATRKGPRVIQRADVRRATQWRRMTYPLERLILYGSVIANLAIALGIAIAIANAPDWVTQHPTFQSFEQKATTTAVIVLLAIPVTPLVRRARVALLRENSVLLGPTQVPAIYEILERECRALGLSPMPDVYITKAIKTLSTSISLVRGGQVILLHGDLFSGTAGVEQRLDVFAFIIGHELGRIRLGHASFWQDLFLGYLKRVPIVRWPLLTVQTLSRDRVSAVLAPDGIRGLLLHAGGADVLEQLDVADYVRKVNAGSSGFWSGLASIARTEPHVSSRVRALYADGFFQLDQDLARLASAPQPEMH
jgi:hypothetical protein